MKLFLSIVLLISHNIYSQTSYDITQDGRINDVSNRTVLLGRDTVAMRKDIVQLQKQAIIYSATTKFFKLDSIAQWNAIKALQDQMLIVNAKINANSIDSAYQAGQIKTLQGQITIMSGRVASLKVDSAKQWEAIKKLQYDVIILQRVNSLVGIGSIKITRVGTTLTYEISNLNASATKDGNLTKEGFLKINDLGTRVTALEKYNQMLHGNILSKAESPIAIPEKAKAVIIIMEE